MIGAKHRTETADWWTSLRKEREVNNMDGDEQLRQAEMARKEHRWIYEWGRREGRKEERRKMQFFIAFAVFFFVFNL
jgi:hypothetical protein